MTDSEDVLLVFEEETKAGTGMTDMAALAAYRWGDYDAE